MMDMNITTKGVLKLLTGLKTNKAIGPDLVSTRFLKDNADEIAPIFTRLFQHTLASGEVPKDWQTTNVIAIYKKGPRSEPSNYRPVSLTCVGSKMLEHIIYHSVMEHLEQNNILVSNQHGFRSRHSCETQLLITIEDIASRINEKKQVDMLILDFSKAFDTVAHQRLIKKLDYYGIRNHTLQWINNWLTTRTQRVVVDGEASPRVYVKSGVPQGTVLGPLLFLLYINDITVGLKSDIRLFADECVLYRTINSPEDAAMLQYDLNTLVQWSNTWQMSFNASKCSLLRIHKKKAPLQTSYTMLEHTLNTVQHHPYLGVEISSDLNWQHHINNTTSKANRSANFVRRNLKQCSTETKSLAYKALVRPILEYASTVWDPHQVNQISQIEKIQRKSARFVTGNYSREASVTTMLENLNWPTLQERRIGARLNMIYKIVNQLVAIQLPSYIHRRQVASRGSHIHQYIIPHSTCDMYKFSFFPRTIRCWNIIPTATITQPNITQFSNMVRSSITDGVLTISKNPRDIYQMPQLGTMSGRPIVLY